MIDAYEDKNPLKKIQKNKVILYNFCKRVSLNFWQPSKIYLTQTDASILTQTTQAHTNVIKLLSNRCYNRIDINSTQMDNKLQY